MTMSGQPVYKRRDRDTRRIIQDGGFKKGMYFTSNLIDSSTSRLLMNYNVRDMGNYVTPRMGLKMNKTQEILTKPTPYRPTDKVPGVHVGFYGMYRDSDGLDKFGDIILGFGVPSSNEYAYYDTDKDSVDSAFRDQVYTNSEGDAFGSLKDTNKEDFPINMDDVGETRLRFYKDTVKPLYSVHNNKLYTIDGTAGEKIGSEKYSSKGNIVREMRFPYNGSFTSFTIDPNNVDVDPFTIRTLNSTGEQLSSVEIEIPLLQMPENSTQSSYDGVKNVFYERIKQYWLEEVHSSDDMVLEPQTNTTFIKIPKPKDSKISNSVSSSNFKTFVISRSEEVNSTDLIALDDASFIGKFSTRADLDYIIYVMYQDSTIEDALYDLSGAYVKYTLETEVEHSLGSENPFVLEENGRIIFDVPRGYFSLKVPYAASYDRPTYSYDGGLQEYEFVKSVDEFRAIPKIIEAKQPKISEATSVGFNMLHTNPYSFANSEGITIYPMGIMPYKVDSDQEILMSANLGEEIEFELFYEYEKGQKYYVKWEYIPLTIGPRREPEVIYESENSILGGTRITQVIKANDDKFTLRATMLPEIEVTDKETKEVTIHPDVARAKVVLYPSYETGNDYLKDISNHQYNLHNATGLGKYHTMLTLWGVPGAETTLFFSDIDDVTYFPFPNNTVSFNHQVLGTHEYMGGLLVITTNSIYVVEGYEPFKFEVTEIYQGLTFTPEDVESLKVIKNIIFIRSRNNYYSITPNMYTGDLTDVRMKTISAPIKELVSDWPEFIQFLSESVFNLDIEWTRRTKVEEYDFFNYLSNDNTIKNVYRFAVKEVQPGSGKEVRHQIDIILNFHTEFGIWTLETANLPFNELISYKDKLYTSYAMAYGEQTKVYTQELAYKNSNRKDFYNTSSYGYYDNDKTTSGIEDELQKLEDVVDATVDYVIDGDTIMTKEYGSIRFHYVDAPEDTGGTSEEFGPEATQIMKDFLPEGSKVKLEFEGDRSDKYGRVLAWVFNHEGLLAQLDLAEKGGVKAIYAFGVSKYTMQIDLAVQNAIDNKIGLWETYDEDLETIHTVKTNDILPNYQVMDTGNKNHDPYLTKRYREFQFQISNKSTNNLKWFNRFYINAKPMQDFREYELHHETDPRHVDYGTITILPKDSSNADADAVTFLNSWEIGENAFPELDIVRIRFKLSGKGEYPRLLMISKNEANYDFLGYSWVMRQMNFR